MSLNKFSLQQNTGSENWMNIKASSMTIKCADDNFINYKCPNIGNDGEVLTSDGLGNVSFGPVNSLVTVPNQELQSIETLDYNPKLSKITWTNTELNTYNLYNYYGRAYRPTLRTPFTPAQNSTIISTEAQLNTAISSQNDNIVFANTITLTSTKTISHSCKISCLTGTRFSIIASGITNMFNVTADNVFFDNVEFVNGNSSSVTTCITFTGNATNNCVHNSVFKTNEFAITSSLPQVQIYNNQFQFEGTPPDSHRYISLSKCTGKTLIYENTFIGNGLLSTACLLISGASTSDFTNGHLFLFKNISDIVPLQRMAIMETTPANFKLTMTENNIETYTDFFILYGDGMLDGFDEITANNNTVTLIDGSPGFKGLVGWDSPGSGGIITYSPIIRGSLNTLPNTLRDDYSPLPNCTNDNPILCFKNTKFSTELQVPINPPLVATTD